VVYIAVAAVVLIGAVALTAPGSDTQDEGMEQPDGVSTFADASEFRSFLSSASQSRYTSTQGFRSGADRLDAPQQEMATTRAAGGDGGAPASPDRVSGTNVQEQGIDEPDVVKTDGESLFYARGGYRRTNTTVLDAFPPENLSVTSSIGDSGELLLANDSLVVLGDERIQGIDVSDPSSPSTSWSVELNGSVETARLYDGELFLVTREDADTGMTCPIRPMSGASDVVIPCDRIYHPPEPAGSQSTYSVMRMDPDSGGVDDAVSFVGSSRNTVVYMSGDDLYLTYREQASETAVMMSFLTGEAADLLDQRARERIQRLQTYNISDRAKRVELESIINDWRGSLSDDRRLMLENELQNRLGNFSERHMREHVRTGIVRIGLESMAVDEQGMVPGTMLNQFSMDAYEGTLRVATTVDGLFGEVESENDVYTLDADSLAVQGSVQGMGVNERIYAVRFIRDKGYVVTFRRIDPFHVLDLSDPSSPVLQGELKLPGFSSYLHQLDDDRILGIGEEQGNVKAVIFDVSDPSNLETADTYRLDEYSSAVNENHRAFLIDRRHEVFFLPGEKGGYVFSYDDGLELVKAVSVENVERARYFDDYLYMIAQEEIVVLDEQDWSVVKRLSLPAVDDHRKPVEPLPGPVVR